MSDDEIGRILDSAAVLPLAELHTRQLALACAGWPLLASVVGASVAADIAAGATGEAAIKRAAAALRDDGPQALDVWDADQREGTIGRAVASSLRNLDDHVAVHGGTALGDRYLDLAIFPPAALIPLAVLGHWWQREHGWTMTGVRQFARVLAERSLLGSYLADEDAVVLHDVFRSCLLYLARRPIVDAHKSLIDSFRTRSPGGWAQLPTDQPYLWRFLTHHLDQADYPEEVISVLADPAFVVAKVNYFGHEPMAEDSLALTSAASRIEPTGEAAVARTLVDATYLAADATSTSDIGATLRAALAWAGQLRSPAADTLRTWTADAFNVRWAAPGASDGSGHTGAVTSVAAAGDCVVSGGEDGSVRIWDRASRRLRRVLRGHHGWVYAVTISPSGEFAASAGDDAIIRLWTVTSGKLIGILTGHTKRIRGLAFDASGARLLSGGEDGSIIVWSIDPAARVRDLATDGRPIWSVAIGHRDQLVAAGGEDENVRIFNLDTGQLVAERSGHQDWVRAVAFAADSPLLASGSGDGTVKLWNVADGHLAMLRSTPVGSRVRALTVSPDAGTIQAADENPMVSRITADGVVQTIAMPAGVDWIRAIAAINRDDNEDGGVDESVLGCEDGAIRLLRNGNVVDLAPGRDTVWSTAFTPDMQAVLLGRSDGIIEVNGALANVRRQHIAAGEGRVWALDTAAGYIAAACGDGAVRAWNLDEGSWSMELGQDGPRAWAVAVHPAGSALAASSGHGLLQLWDLPSGRLRWRCEAHAGRVRTVAFDPTGATLTTGGGDGFVRIWDTATGQRVSEVRGSAGWVRTVGVDDSAKRVIVGLGSGDVSVHDTTRAEPPVHLFGHGGRVLAAHFVGDDELVTAAADGTVRLWSLSAQRQRAQVRLDASLQCAYVDRYTGSVLASSSAGVIALDLRRTAKET